MMYFIICWQCRNDKRSMFERVKFTCLSECTDYILKVLKSPCNLDRGFVVAIKNEAFTDDEYEYVCVNASDVSWRIKHDVMNFGCKEVVV